LLALAERLKKTSRDDQPVTQPSIRQNAILNALNDSSTASILERGTLARIVLRQKIYEAEQLINDVYFPLDCVLSVVARMRDGSQIEVGTIGREGMSAFPLLMGASSTANVCYCQVRGSAIRIPADLFRELAASDPGFRQLLDRYLQAYVNMLGQLAACNRLHTIYERCSRWLLMTRDRMNLDAIPLTQEFLAMMLGTGQSGVAIAAGTLQHAGLIKYTRGMITILDQPGLEAASCECYAVARSQFGGLLRAVPGAREKTPRAKTVKAKPTLKTFGAKRMRFENAPDRQFLLAARAERLDPRRG
jgi:CRP-like cAMP-binding protein